MLYRDCAKNETRCISELFEVQTKYKRPAVLIFIFDKVEHQVHIDEVDACFYVRNKNYMHIKSTNFHFFKSKKKHYLKIVILLTGSDFNHLRYWT